ncbi:MAG: hypothetical protein K2H86_01150 [Muribaculaceae bacterium]|nr:hypothetical protein [Muribaculaceae bacterium]
MYRRLDNRLSLREIKELCADIISARADRNDLWIALHSDNDRIAVNALWIMTHLPADQAEWLYSIRQPLIDMLLSESHPSKRRLILQILREQEYTADDIPTDLLDYCLSRINAECEPYAVRCFSLYTAYKMCRHYPELLNELQEHLHLLATQPLSPGLRSAYRQITHRLDRLTRINNRKSR